MPNHFHGLFWFDVEELETKAPTQNGVGSGLSRTNKSVQHGKQAKPAPALSGRLIAQQDESAPNKNEVGSGLSRPNSPLSSKGQVKPTPTLQCTDIQTIIEPNYNNLLSKDAPLNISKIMHRIKGRTAIEIRNELHINFKWQQYFYDFNIYTRKKYLEKLNYIHNNQYRDKSILTLDTYPYSSMTFL